MLDVANEFKKVLLNRINLHVKSSLKLKCYSFIQMIESNVKYILHYIKTGEMGLNITGFLQCYPAASVYVGN